MFNQSRTYRTALKTAQRCQKLVLRKKYGILAEISFLKFKIICIVYLRSFKRIFKRFVLKNGDRVPTGKMSVGRKKEPVFPTM